MTDELFAILNAPTWLLDDIEGIESKLNAYRAQMLPSGIRYDQDKVRTSPEDKMPEYAAKIEDLLHLREKKRRERFYALNRVEKLADQLDGPEKKIIIMRYMEQRRYEDIAGDLYMSERQMFRYRRQAIDKLEKLTVKVSDSV